MKKIKLLTVSLLTVLLCMFCLVGCSVEGQYKLSKWKLPVLGTEIVIDEEADSSLSINLEKDGVVTVSGKLVVAGSTILDMTTPTTGSWEKNEDGTVKISAGLLQVNATVKGGEMVFESSLLGTLTLKK